MRSSESLEVMCGSSWRQGEPRANLCLETG